MAEQQDVHLIRAPDQTHPVVEDLVERQIDATDRGIDQLVHELDGLTDEEIAAGEGGREAHRSAVAYSGCSMPCTVMWSGCIQAKCRRLQV